MSEEFLYHKIVVYDFDIYIYCLELCCIILNFTLLFTHFDSLLLPVTATHAHGCTERWQDLGWPLADPRTLGWPGQSWVSD